MSTQPLTAQVSLLSRSQDYLAFLETWLVSRSAISLEDVVEAAGAPENIAVVSVDLIAGFCHDGPLASDRVAGILPDVASLINRADQAGIRNVVLCQDSHRPDAEEFSSYPPHCIGGTSQSVTVSELSSLPQAGGFTIVEKNSISSMIAIDYLQWERERGPFTTYIVIGDCTDLCVYQAAMGLMVRSHANNLGHRVVVPINCVETFDVSVGAAERIGAQPHPGDLMHHVFLHSMAQNGIEIVAAIT